LVFDASGVWMSRWHHQFAALEIPHLRSPAVHHPDPDAYALRRFAELRPQELYPPYSLPGTALFKEFCQDVVKRWQLQDRLVPLAVEELEPIVHHSRKRFLLGLKDGRSLLARRVVLAAGSHQPNLPEWVKEIPANFPKDRLLHANQIDLRTLQIKNERILIVGGGLTSGHLALGALARGAKVVLTHRRQFREKLFDSDPGWLGPKYLNGFWNEPHWGDRWKMIQEARDGGSLTMAVMTQLRRANHCQQLSFQECCRVVQAKWQGFYWQVQCDNGTTQEFDRIWLATGTRLNAETEPLLSTMNKVFPIPLVNGLPVLEKDLRWGKSDLFLMGGLTALRVGPAARNLSGGRMASRCIVPALT
jgi:cation diffusion facilitator CzcD-associated flavoprotein CzcO